MEALTTLVSAFFPATTSRGAHRARRLALAALAAGLTTAGWLAFSGHARQAQPTGAPAPGLQRLLLRRLTAEANRAPTTVVWSHRQLHVMSRVVAGDVWRLASLESRGTTCWALIVHRVAQAGTCGGTADVRSRELLIYEGAAPARHTAGRFGGYVAYGLASGAVRSLRLTLTDCTTVGVDLTSRPLYWVFVPAEKLRHGVAASGFVADVGSQEPVRGRLLPLEPTARQSGASVGKTCKRPG